MGVMNILGKPPKEISNAKNLDDIVHLFNQTFSNSFLEALPIRELKNFEDNLKKDIKSLKLEINVSNFELAWYIIIAIYLRHLYIVQQDSDYAIQILEMILGNIKNYDVDKFKTKIITIYSMGILKSGEGSLVPRHSKIDEPLPQMGGFVYSTLFDKRKTLINIINKSIPKDKVDIKVLSGYFPTIEIKSKPEITEAIFDILYSTLVNEMTKSGEDIYDFPEMDDKEFVDIVQILYKNVSSSLNSFINDIGIINDCSERFVSSLAEGISRKLA